MNDVTGTEDRPLVRPIGGDETVAEAVVLAVLAARRQFPGLAEVERVTDLDPLSATVDADALDALARDRFDGRLEFQWAGCRVVVDGGSRVVVTPAR